jgi:hypothetical protein
VNDFIMKTSSAKAKGKRCAQEVKELLLEYALLEDGDVVVTPSGVPGVDLHLSPLAFKEFPFAIECKNQESIQIWQALKQAESHQPGIPTLFFKRNRSELYCALKASDLFQLLKGNPKHSERLESQ